MPSQPLPMSAFARVHTFLQLLVKTYLGSLVYLEMIILPCFFFLFFFGGGGMSGQCLYLSGLLAYTLPGDYFTKEGNAGATEMTLISVKF